MGVSVDDKDIVCKSHLDASQRHHRAVMARKNSGKRRMVDPTTTDKIYSVPELEFSLAMEQYKKVSGRKFPTYSETLEVLISLGYRKISPTGPLPGER